MPDYSFGEKMAAMRREAGTKPPGRRPIRDRHGVYISKTEATFAATMPANAVEYVAALKGKAPERCPTDDRVLACPDCGHESERTFYDHKSATYMFDRILGRPTSRSEGTLTIALVQKLSEVFAQAFAATNGIEDEQARREAFAAQLTSLTDSYDAGGR